jgi:hypothetical protein
MKGKNIKARIKRNMLAELSGKYFIDEEADLVKDLNRRGKNAFLGIQREDNIYTIIGEDKIYYSTSLDNEYEISINEFLEILSREALRSGKFQSFEFVNIKNDIYIWVMNAQTMNALWNTMLLFDTRI